MAGWACCRPNRHVESSHFQLGEKQRPLSANMGPFWRKMVFQDPAEGGMFVDQDGVWDAKGLVAATGRRLRIFPEHVSESAQLELR